MKFLVTGGAGFLGINLVRYLLARGQDVASLDFAEFDYDDCRDTVQIFRSDIRDAAAVAAAVQGADIVVHCAAALPLYSRQDIVSTDIDGTRNVLTASEAAGVQRVVHVSSTAVYGVPDHHPLYEDDRLHGVGPYGEAKIAAEEVCIEFRRKGMCVPILRPKSFVGPERLGVFAMFYEWARTGHGFPIIGSGRNRYQLLDVEDLCEAIWRASTMDRDAVNDVFNIGAAEYTTFKQDFQAVLDHAGFGRKIRSLPARPVIWTLKLLEALKLSPLYKWVYETAGQESFVSIDKARTVLEFTPRYSNQQALIRNYDWYIANLHKFQSQKGVSHRVPWSQGILKLAKWFF